MAGQKKNREKARGLARTSKTTANDYDVVRPLRGNGRIGPVSSDSVFNHSRSSASARLYARSIVDPFESGPVRFPDEDFQPTALHQSRFYVELPMIQLSDRYVAGITLAANALDCYRYLSAANGQAWAGLASATWTEADDPKDADLTNNAYYYRSTSMGIRVHNRGVTDTRKGSYRFGIYPGDNSEGVSIPTAGVLDDPADTWMTTVNCDMQFHWYPCTLNGSMHSESADCPAAINYRLPNTTTIYENNLVFVCEESVASATNDILVEVAINYEYIPLTSSDVETRVLLGTIGPELEVIKDNPIIITPEPTPIVTTPISGPDSPGGGVYDSGNYEGGLNNGDLPKDEDMDGNTIRQWIRGKFPWLNATKKRGSKLIKMVVDSLPGAAEAGGQILDAVMHAKNVAGAFHELNNGKPGVHTAKVAKDMSRITGLDPSYFMQLWRLFGGGDRGYGHFDDLVQGQGFLRKAPVYTGPMAKAHGIACLLGIPSPLREYVDHVVKLNKGRVVKKIVPLPSFDLDAWLKSTALTLGADSVSVAASKLREEKEWVIPRR